MLNGIGLSNFRSICQDVQRIGIFKKINFFIGQNNSGKSNIINFLYDYQKITINPLHEKTKEFSYIDNNLGLIGQERIFELCIDIEFYKKNDSFNTKYRKKDIYSAIDKLFHSKTLNGNGKYAWFPYRLAGNAFQIDTHKLIQGFLTDDVLSNQDWSLFWNKFTNSTGGSLEKSWIPQVFEIIDPKKYLTRKTIHLIPAIRQIGELDSNDGDLSGGGIIKKLAKLQNPKTEDQKDRAVFEKINDFLRKVLENNSATIEIPHDRKTINVHMDNKVLPLASLGTGIHEVIILASAAIMISDEIICIEEPEIHLHPTLQRKLIQYLDASTDNQYFITTHSSHFLDSIEASIFHVRNNGKCSTYENVDNNNQKLKICKDLGYKASDLLQTNCVIWVEGPSDRIYINHWIRQKNDELKEGIHYSIMFYGGRLLSHLTADENIQELISLITMNRYSAIVLDSDRDASKKRINDTKKRIISEFEKVEFGFAWLTEGREIENYIDIQQLKAAVEKIKPNIVKKLKFGQYDNILKYADKNTSKYIDKVKVAQQVIQEKTVFSVLNLNKKTSQLIEFIKNANGMV